MDEPLLRIVTTVSSGLILTFILFIIKEYIQPGKNVSGEWDAILKIDKSNVTNFQDLSLLFRVHLLHGGSQISGSGEKIKELFPDGKENVFLPEKRVKIEITGFYEKRYLRKSKIFLNIVEYGRKRESRSTYKLIVQKKNLLTGTFASTAADSKGSIKMSKL